jgi:ABC-2 type transport system ATP-binding protein
VTVFGHNSFKLPGTAKARVGFVPQQDELIDQLTARDQLRVIGSFYSKWDIALLERLSAEWELDLNQRVRELSVGQRQKLSILLALGHRPDLLMLDEPVASLDPIARRQFLEQIVEIATDGNRAVVFSSHIVSDIERLANKIWILKNGCLYWRGDLDALKETVVRVHLRRNEPFANGFKIDGAFSQRFDGARITAVVSGWSNERHRILRLESGGEVDVEPLALEEIFVELHR